MTDDEKKYYEGMVLKYSEKIRKHSAEVYSEIAAEMGSPYDAQTMLINALSITYGNCIAIYCHRHVGGDIQDLADAVYTDLQLLMKDLLAKHSGKMSFAIQVTPVKGEKKEENHGGKDALSDRSGTDC